MRSSQVKSLLRVASSGSSYCLPSSATVARSTFRSMPLMSTKIATMSSVSCRVPKSMHMYSMCSHLSTSSSSSSSIAETDSNASADTSFADVPGAKTSGEKYVLMFTCKVCDTRSAKKITKHSYHSGVVVVRCACCRNLHLIVDNIGIFEEPGWNINAFLEHHEGQGVKYINDENIIELSAEDIAGHKKAVAPSEPTHN